MSHKLLLLTVLLSLMSVGLLAQDAPGPGNLTQDSIAVDTLHRKFLLYVPEAYDGTSDWPLVLNFHGALSTAEQQMFTSGMNNVADTAHFLVVYPQGILNDDGFVGWNDPGVPELQDDVEFINVLLDSLIQEYNIDQYRIFATGLSNGGGMSFTLACALSHRIAAVASVAAPGGFYPDCNPGRAVPILYMHGTADSIVPFEGGVGVFIPREFLAARDQLDFWRDQNGCMDEPVITELPDINTTDSSTVILEQYTNCANSSDVWFYQINNGGHTWPDGPPVPPGFEVLGNVNRDINASSEIWNFFRKFELPQSELVTAKIMVDSVEREYRMYIPAAYDGTEAWPVVFNFHELRGGVDLYLSIVNTNSVADAAHFLVVYPVGEQVPDPFIGGTSVGWHDGILSNDSSDLLFIDHLIDHLEEELNVDTTRFYAMGYGNGGAMAARLACELENHLAAIANLQGFIDCTPPNSQTPALFMFGTGDPFFPITGVPGLLPSFLDGVKNWGIANSCDTVTVETALPDIAPTDSSTVTLIEYPNCPDSSEVLFYLLEGGGRQWPGGRLKVPDSGPVNFDIDADVEIWEFFTRHKLIVSTNTVLPEQFKLQVYPNPFSTMLNFDFTLTEKSRVKLDLYNPLGQLITTISDQLRYPGKQRVQWERPASAVPAGLYYYRLQVGRQVVGRPVIVK